MDKLFKKVVETINSCTTYEQLIASKKFMFLYLKTFDKVIEYYNKYDELNQYITLKRIELQGNDKR